MDTRALSPKVQPSGATVPEWRSRGYLPHYDVPHALQMITFRLADALPAEIVGAIMADPRIRTDSERWERMQKYLDAGHGACHLRDPRVARASSERTPALRRRPIPPAALERDAEPCARADRNDSGLLAPPCTSFMEVVHRHHDEQDARPTRHVLAGGVLRPVHTECRPFGGDGGVYRREPESIRQCERLAKSAGRMRMPRAPERE